MYKNSPQMVTEMNRLLGELRGAQPDTMKCFAQLSQAALKGDALDTKTKELIALAISVAVRCDPCIAYHARAAVQAGASDEELAEAMGMAIYMGAGPSVMYAAQALEAAGQWREAMAAPR
jgi:AhpD family alkylhydroperoxidase